MTNEASAECPRPGVRHQDHAERAARRSAPRTRLLQQPAKDLCSDNIYERWFSNVDGLSATFVLAAGLEGALYFFDGRDWRKIETHTSAPLGEMAFFEDGKAYVAGAQSVLLFGQPQKGFQRVGVSSRDLALYTICRFAGRVFIGTQSGVFEFEETTRGLKSIDMLGASGDVILLQSAQDVMWAFGSKYVRRYDGKDWMAMDQNL